MSGFSIIAGVLEAAAQAVEQHDKEGREWIPGSLWDALSREGAERIRSLKAILGDGEDPLTEAAILALAEARQSAQKWPAYNSAHEGFGVLLEEVDELKAHVWTRQPKRDLAAMRAEAQQIAAVALRFAAEVCNEDVGRR